ncbi:MAG: exo-beta-N-acetylmuramidase NamZ domain-containing protein, partial [Aggregatilineales bacterium]
MTVRIGLEALLTDQIELVAGRRVGLVASASSVDAVLVSSVERLRQHPAVSLRALFRPEHGLRGDTQAGEHVGTSTDRVTGLPLIVLDRPAPLNGVMVEGPTLDPRFASFVGPYPIPLRYGLTAGEIARLFNTAFNIKCDLTVVPLDGWRRSMW